MNIAVLMTCHNRRETTLRCLAALLRALQDSEKCEVESEKLRCDVFLVDDGSTDGTGEAVREWANSATSHFSLLTTHYSLLTTHYSLLTTHLIRGSGSLYWAKGMALAWREALKYEESLRYSTSTFNFNSFLWLNDDTILRPDALEKACAAMRAARRSAPTGDAAVVVGSLTDEGTGARTCGVTEGGLFTGNFVLVPRDVYTKVGMLHDGFRHAWADSDYAMRSNRAGVRVIELTNVGTTRAHDLRPSLVGTTLFERWRLLFDPKGWNLHDLWLYRRRNWGFVKAVFSSLHLIAHVLKGVRR